MGVDYRISDQLAIGMMGEYSHTWTSLNPSGHIDVDSGRGGLYATWFHRGIYLNGAIYGGHNNFDSSRSVLRGQANGGTEGAEWSTFISGGDAFHFGHLTIGPIAAFQYTRANIDGFSENGSLAPMQIHSDSSESLRSNVGFRTFYQWQLGKVLVSPVSQSGLGTHPVHGSGHLLIGICGILNCRSHGGQASDGQIFSNRGENL